MRNEMLQNLTARTRDNPYWWVCSYCANAHNAQKERLESYKGKTSCEKCAGPTWDEPPHPQHSGSMLYIQEPITLFRRDVLQLLKYERLGQSNEPYWDHRNALLQPYGQNLIFPVAMKKKKEKDPEWMPEYAPFTATPKVVNGTMLLKTTWIFTLKPAVLLPLIRHWVSVCTHQVPTGAAMDGREGQGNLLTTFLQAFGRPNRTVFGGCRDCRTDFSATVSGTRTYIECWRDLGTENLQDIAVWASQCTYTQPGMFLHRQVDEIGSVRDLWENDTMVGVQKSFLCSEGVYTIGPVEPHPARDCMCLHNQGPGHSWRVWTEKLHREAPEPKSQRKRKPVDDVQDATPDTYQEEEAEEDGDEDSGSEYGAPAKRRRVTKGKKTTRTSRMTRGKARAGSQVQQQQPRVQPRAQPQHQYPPQQRWTSGQNPPQYQRQPEARMQIVQQPGYQYAMPTGQPNFQHGHGGRALPYGSRQNYQPMPQRYPQNNAQGHHQVTPMSRLYPVPSPIPQPVPQNTAPANSQAISTPRLEPEPQPAPQNMGPVSEQTEPQVDPLLACPDFDDNPNADYPEDVLDIMNAERDASHAMNASSNDAVGQALDTRTDAELFGDPENQPDFLSFLGDQTDGLSPSAVLPPPGA